MILYTPFPGRCGFNLKLLNLKLISRREYLENFLWLVNIGSGNGLVPEGTKPLPEPLLTQDLCHHMASLGHNKLTHWGWEMHQQTRPPLVQIMACHLFGAKPLSEPMLDYFQWTLANIFQWNYNQNKILLIQENAFENVIAKWQPFCLSLKKIMVFSRPRQ